MMIPHKQLFKLCAPVQPCLIRPIPLCFLQLSQMHDFLILVTGPAAEQDMSPPRKRSKGVTADPVSNPARPGPSHTARFMPDGGRAGKVTGAELAAELQAKTQREAKQYAALDQQLTGHGADTVQHLCHTLLWCCWAAGFGDDCADCLSHVHV